MAGQAMVCRGEDGQGLGGIEVMGADPGHAAQQHDHEQRDAPDDELDAAGIGPIREIAGPGVGSAEPPGEGEGRDDRRDDDGEHDGEGIDQDRLLGDPDGALRVEDGRLTGRQEERCRQGPRSARHAIAAFLPKARQPHSWRSHRQI